MGYPLLDAVTVETHVLSDPYDMGYVMLDAVDVETHGLSDA